MVSQYLGGKIVEIAFMINYWKMFKGEVKITRNSFFSLIISGEAPTVNEQTVKIFYHSLFKMYLSYQQNRSMKPLHWTKFVC